MKILIKQIEGCVIQITFLIFVSILLSFDVPGLSAKTTQTCPQKSIETVGPIDSSIGLICGKVVTLPSSEKAANAYLGIRYGQSTAGPKRWTHSVKAEKSTSLIEALDFGPICPQDSTGYPPGIKALPQDEDCLFLNVWTPHYQKTQSSSSSLPVMVFIYGGGFFMGASSFPFYDGSYIAANKNVIVVSFNYRLGALGFLALDFGSNETSEKLLGNFGFQDQQLALTWVKDNIEAFGGDPNRVTLFGESAGAQSVSLHLVSAPGSKDLFQAGIMESNLFPRRFLKTLKEQTEIGNNFAQQLGCQDLKCLRNQKLDKLLNKQSHVTLNKKETEKDPDALDYTFIPTIDSKIITIQPILGVATTSSSKPILLGTNKNEAVYFTENKPKTAQQFTAEVKELFGDYYDKVTEEYPPSQNDQTYNGKLLSKLKTDFIFRCSTHYFATQYAKNITNPVYTYLFNYSPPFIFPPNPSCSREDNACHTAEIAFVFHSAKSIGGTFTTEGAKLSSEVIDYWTNFATYQNPSGPNSNSPIDKLPQWPQFTIANKQYMILDVNLRSSKAREETKHCDFWDSVSNWSSSN